MSATDFDFTSIDGKPLKLSQFSGKLVLVVNTASECGLTPQYKGLQELWSRYRDRSFVVLGVPSNDFGAQEPGREADIQKFCDLNYAVTFPMTSKNPVVGDNAHPFYKWATTQSGEAPKWNFHKYLISPQGALLKSFGSRVAPDDASLITEIESHLPK